MFIIIITIFGGFDYTVHSTKELDLARNEVSQQSLPVNIIITY